MQETTREKGKILSTLEVTFPEYSEQFSDVFGATSMKLLEEFPTANLMLEIDENSISDLMTEASGGKLGQARTSKLRGAAACSIGVHSNAMALGLSGLE